MNSGEAQKRFFFFIYFLSPSLKISLETVCQFLHDSWIVTEENSETHEGLC